MKTKSEVIGLFTGIIEEIGVLKKKERGNNKFQLVIEANKVTADLTKGESIAVNGVCLTVVEYTDQYFRADVMPETLKNTNLDKLVRGVRVNLELPLQPHDFMGGHIVSGHIDGIGTIERIEEDNNAKLVEIQFPGHLEKYIVDKGSIAINGISLTIVKVENNIFQVSLIPETWRETNLKYIDSGDKINLETDIIGKYIVKMIGKYNNLENETNQSQIDKDFLKENGFL